MILEWFNTAWGWVVSILGGLSYSAILTAIIVAIIKGNNNRNNAKQTEIVKELAKETIDTSIAEAIGSIKTIVHKHDIEPLVDARLKDVAKITSEEQTKALKDLHEENQKIVNILEKFAIYFDDSYYISAEAKQELKDAIADAKDEEEPNAAESEIVEPLIEVEPNTENTTQKQSQKATSIER